MRRAVVLMLAVTLAAAIPTFHTDFMLPDVRTTDPSVADNVLAFLQSLKDMPLYNVTVQEA